MSIARTAEDYHQQTRKQVQKQPKFKISDMVAIKINKVDNINPFHPNMVLGQIIEIEESGRIVGQSMAKLHCNTDQTLAILSLYCH